MSREEQSPNRDFTQFDGLTAEELVKEFGRLKALKEAQESRLADTQAMYDFVRLIKIPQVFEERDISILKVAGVGRCQLAGDLHASIISTKQAEAFEYLRDTGRESLIKETVNSSTLKAAMKEAMKAGETIPEEFFNVKPFTRASLVKG